jgi:Glutaminase
MVVATARSRRVRNSSMAVHGSPDALEPDQAVSLFAEFKAAEELALRFPADGCYARTHLMVRRMLDRGLAPSKIWAFAASATDLLWTETSAHPDGRVQWHYHVAPVLVVRGPDSDTREMVLDPCSSTARFQSRSGKAHCTTRRP